MTIEQSSGHFFISDALSQYSENFRIIDRNNPISFRLNNVIYSAHISAVHDSGEARSNEDEVRIQITREHIEIQRSRFEDGQRVAFIGVFSGGQTIVAWDPRYIFSLRTQTIVSVYARQSQLDKVEQQLAAIHSFQARYLGEISHAIAIPSFALGLYFENIERFHNVSSEKSIQDLMHLTDIPYSDRGLGQSGELPSTDPKQREKFSFERTAYPRDPRFTKWVLDAYNHACCICGNQLGLVQAAHIIPHSDPDSRSTVQNGLALCVEHHKLYDTALLLPGPSQTLVYNILRADYLVQTGQAHGLTKIKDQSKRKYTIPEDEESQPSDSNLQRGLDLRIGA